MRDESIAILNPEDERKANYEKHNRMEGRKRGS